MQQWSTGKRSLPSWGVWVQLPRLTLLQSRFSAASRLHGRSLEVCSAPQSMWYWSDGLSVMWASHTHTHTHTHTQTHTTPHNTLLTRPAVTRWIICRHHDTEGMAQCVCVCVWLSSGVCVVVCGCVCDSCDCATSDTARHVIEVMPSVFHSENVLRKYFFHIIKGALWGNLRWQGPPHINIAEQYETVSSFKVSAKNKEFVY